LSILDGAGSAVEVASFTASDSQSFANATVSGDGTNAQFIGNLNLSGGTTLNVAVGKTFAVAAPSANSSLSVAGGGVIRLPNTAKITLAAINPTYNGTLALNGTNSIAGRITSDNASTTLAAVGTKGTTGTTYNSPNLTIGGTGDGDGTAGANTATAAIANGVITITGNGTGSTLNSSGSIIRVSP
jgi:hypothetical protein